MLTEAFPYYLQKNPINLPHLMLELVRISKEWNRDFVEKTAKAEHFLPRWGSCEVLDDGGHSSKTKKYFLEILGVLKTDSSCLIASEALLRFERINIKTAPKLPKPD